jgi:hypothetical protein
MPFISNTPHAHATLQSIQTRARGLSAPRNSRVSWWHLEVSMTASPIELAVFAEFLGTFVFQLFGGTEQTADNNGLRELLLRH